MNLGSVLSTLLKGVVKATETSIQQQTGQHNDIDALLALAFKQMSAADQASFRAEVEALDAIVSVVNAADPNAGKAKALADELLKIVGG